MFILDLIVLVMIGYCIRWVFKKIKGFLERRELKKALRSVGLSEVKLEEQQVHWEFFKSEKIKLYHRKADGNYVLPTIYYHKDGGIVLDLPTTVHKEDVEKVLPSLARYFNRDFNFVKEFGGLNLKSLIELSLSKLPDLVSYSERPVNIKNFWLGVDMFGENVELDFGHSPAMLITGASGSGKSVLGQVMLREAHKQSYKITLVDGKGGIDWMGSPVDEILTEFEVIAEMYESKVEEMNKRLALLLKKRKDKNDPYLSWKTFLKPELIFMDEASDFFNVGSKANDANYAIKHRIINAVEELVRKSRAVGMFQVFSLQASNASSIPQGVKDNTGFRVAYALPTAAMSQTLFESSIAYDASLRKGKGVFKGVDGEPVIFRGAFMGAN